MKKLNCIDCELNESCPGFNYCPKMYNEKQYLKKMIKLDHKIEGLRHKRDMIMRSIMENGKYDIGGFEKRYEDFCNR